MERDPDAPISRHRLKREGKLDQPQFSTVHDMLAWEAEQRAARKKEGDRKRAESVARYQQARIKAEAAIRAAVRREEEAIRRYIHGDEE
jgi:hypothetical protein